MAYQLTKEQVLKLWGEIVADREKKIKLAKTRKFDTIATHGIYDFEQALTQNSASIMEPIYLSSAQVYRNTAELELAYEYKIPAWIYSRIANPSMAFLEDTVALLETHGSDIHASCCATSSGLSAIRTVTDALLVKDDSLPPANFVSCSKIYGGTFQQFSVRRMKEAGIEVRWVKDPMNMEEWASKIDKGTRFLYGEFPTNPTVDIFDITKVAELAHLHGIPLIVDSTCASPAITRPIVLGADIAVHSATKVIGSNGTSIAGLFTARHNLPSRVGCDEMKADFATWVKLWPFRDNGPCIGPMSAILLLNDLRTIRMRVANMSKSAMKVATYLESHPKIEKVHYPGLKSYKNHAIAQKYMKLADTDENAYGFMLAADIKEKEWGDISNARTFYDNLNLLYRATDLGRVKTIATLCAISTHQQQGKVGRDLAEMCPSICRISVGIEDPDDLIKDLEQALSKI
jgi:O-acetylhomoserine/O-acetylserine sulfhydrylase-like pyridoxal-dependent enzyme